jgi:hypothetical protein
MKALAYLKVVLQGSQRKLEGVRTEQMAGLV